jgi:hypothetical protein
LNAVQPQRSQSQELLHCITGGIAPPSQLARQELAPQRTLAAVQVAVPLQDNEHGPRLPHCTDSVAQLSVPEHKTRHRYNAGHWICASVQALPPWQLTSQAKPGGHTLMAPVQAIPSQSIWQTSPEQPPLHTVGHWPRGGSGASPH